MRMLFIDIGSGPLFWSILGRHRPSRMSEGSTSALQPCDINSPSPAMMKSGCGIVVGDRGGDR